MGTLCTLLLAERGVRVTLWGASPQRIAVIARDRENRRYLPGHPLPDTITPTADPERALADRPQLIVSAVPCQYLRAVWSAIAHHMPESVPVVSVTKGIENGTLLRPTQIIQQCAAQAGHAPDRVPLACLSGPSIAPEVAARKPATVVVAADDPGVAGLVQTTLSTKYFRVYTSGDLLGVELAGAVKNIIALAAGICDGIEAGDNAKASLITRGLVEITRLGHAMGAHADTFRGLAGVGDLITTGVSQVGRNRSAGEKIGRGMTADAVVASTPSIIEGIPTTRSVLALAAKHHVELPIVSAVASVLFDGRSPADAIDALMTRRLREEYVA